MLEALFANIREAAILADAGSLIQRMNPAAETLTQFTEQRAVGKPWDQILRLEPIEVVPGKEEDATQQLLTDPSGRQRVVEYRVINLDSQALHLVRDLSELQEVEAALRESRELFQDLYEDSPDMMVSVDPETAQVVQCNKAVCRVLGYDVEQVLGRPIFEFYHPDSRGKVQQALEKFRIEGELRDVELTLLTQSGRPLEVLLNSSAVRDDNGRIIRSRSVWRDVTKHANALKELERTTERLNFVLSSTGIGLWFNPLPLQELQWDERTREIFFLEKDDRPTLELFESRLHPDDLEPTLSAMDSAIKNRELYSIDHRVINPISGEVSWRRSMGMATYSEAGVPTRFDGLNYDITEQKLTEEKLRQLASQLSEADRRKDEFLATLAHELRNPLAPISMGLQVMKDLRDDPDKWLEVRATMERQANQLIVLVDDLLDVSRITRGKLV
ncbi:MAG: PAS domain S-box protein, partial [Candidatus Eremiobacteraeota bacterium]|nr:PAS domain S-box protein [Candidatus Eremiobacteraeota bacterium]